MIGPTRVSDTSKVRSQADLILEANRAIQYVAAIDYSNKVIESKSRDTLSLALPQEKVREFVSIGPLLVMGALGHKLETSCGCLSFVVGRFAKAQVVIYQLRTEMIVLVTTIIGMDELEEIASFLHKSEKRLLALPRVTSTS